MAEVTPSWLVAAEQGAELSELRIEVTRLRSLVEMYQGQGFRPAACAGCPVLDGATAPPPPAGPVEYLGSSALAAHYEVERAAVTHWVTRSRSTGCPFPAPAVTIRTPKLALPGWHPRQFPDIDSWRIAWRNRERQR